MRARAKHWALLICLASPVCAWAQSQPFTIEDRWQHYLRRTYGPGRIGLLAVESAFDHARHEPSCWDATAESYGLRYGRAFGRRIIRNTAELGAGILTGEDLRYRPLGEGSFRQRVWRAAFSSVTARTRGGGVRPAYTRVFSTLAVDAATVHWTSRPIRTGLLLESSAWSLLDQFETNLLDEFGPDLRRAGKRAWQRLRRR